MWKNHFNTVCHQKWANIKIKLHIPLTRAFTLAWRSTSHLNLISYFSGVLFFALVCDTAKIVVQTNQIRWHMTFNLICTLKSENKFAMQILNDTWKCRSFDLFFFCCFAQWWMTPMLEYFIPMQYIRMFCYIFRNIEICRFVTRFISISAYTRTLPIPKYTAILKRKELSRRIPSHSVRM